MADPNALVICYGNPLRGDDGVALQVARLLKEDPQLGSQAVDVRELHQLDVTLAEDVSGCDKVIFVDAELRDGLSDPRVTAIQDGPAAGLRANVHSITPADIVALAARLYGNAPEALLVAVPAYDMEHGDSLTPDAMRAAEAAAKLVRGLL